MKLIDTIREVFEHLSESFLTVLASDIFIKSCLVVDSFAAHRIAADVLLLILLGLLGIEWPHSNTSDCRPVPSPESRQPCKSGGSRASFASLDTVRDHSKYTSPLVVLPSRQKFNIEVFKL